MIPSGAKPVHFLLAEDDPAHADLVRMAFEDNGISNRLTHVSDGEQVIQYLRRLNGFTNADRPDVILLDLNLPKLNGHEVLQEIKNDSELMSIPVVILTTSANEQDRAAAYEHNANSYLTKPIEFSKFQKMIRDLKMYWCIWNQPPPAKPMAG